MRTIAKSGSIEEFETGQTIYEQGDVGAKLYLLSEGQVSLYRKLTTGHIHMAKAKVYVLREIPHRKLLGGRAWADFASPLVQERSGRRDKHEYFYL